MRPKALLFLFCFALSLLESLALQPATAAEVETPNVVFILVDDLGWMDLSCQGSDYFRTPRIDDLAERGVRFTNAYAACAVCSPTRAAVITGRWPGRLGVTDWIRARFQRQGIGTPDKNPTAYVGGKKQKLKCPPNAFWMEHEEITMAELLKKKGYATGFIGKWHLGDPAWYPPSQGFDVNVAGCDIGQPPNYFDPYDHPRYGFDGQLKPRKKGEFLTHREGDEAASFIREHADEPFLLYYCPYAVHTPIQAIDEVAKRYEREGKNKNNARYAAMVESVDDAVGMIVDTLREKQLESKTMIVFTSDNGGLLGPTDNSPLRSGKGYAYEGGIRVPAIVCWPGVVPSGVESDLPISSVDYLPTVCEATGTPVNDDLVLDGVSLMAHLRSAGETRPERESLIWHFPHYRHRPGPYSIIRSGDWKLIRWYEGPVELYNLREDVAESTNLIDQKPQVAKRLDAMLSKELKRIGAKLPVPNPDFVGQ